MPSRPAIIVHGGAGNWPRERQPEGLAGVRKAATKGFRVLEKGGSAMNGVEDAVKEMEDNSVFNAGTGSTLNLIGSVEADAGIMNGRTREGAGVALLRHVKNPITLARIVLERTDHAMLAGRSAERMAEIFGLPMANLKTRDKVYQWKQATRKISGSDMVRYPRNLKLVRRYGRGVLGDTVGALAIDIKGDLAAADSTGGVFLKLPGRIGDSPILGAGLYADNTTGAATATGLGEIAIRMVVSKSACDAMSSLNAQHAAQQTVNKVTRLVGKELGIITLDSKGRYGVAHNTPHLCWASYNSQEGLVSRMRQ